MDNPEFALENLEKSLEIQRELLGENHPDTGTALHNVGVAYATQGDHTQALGYKEKALDIRRGQLGHAHPATVDSILSLTRSYERSRNAPKALTLLDGALGQLPRDDPAYNQISRRKMEVLSALAGGGFRQQPQKGQSARKKKRRK